MPDWILWALHGLYWVPYLVRGQLDRMRGRQPQGPTVHAAPYARLLVAAHTLATVFTHLGLAAGVGLHDAAVLFPGQEWVGLAGVVVASGLAWWTLWVFRSWRLRAELTAQHELCTDGPFAWLRHPIYASLTLLNLASFVWMPNFWTALATLSNLLVGELRGRAEERLLVAAFGARYTAYMARTARWIPGVV